MIRTSPQTLLICLLWFTALSGAQTLPTPGSVAESSGNPAFDNLVAAAKIYFRDTVEFPMVQVTTVTVTDSAGKSRKPSTVTGDYLFHGYSKNTSTANATFHRNVSLWTGLRGAKSTQSAMNGSLFTMLPGLQIYSGKNGFAIEDDAGAQDQPKIKLIPTTPCEVFTLMEMPETYLPRHPCGEMQFELTTDSKLQKFTFESAGLPAQLNLNPLGSCSLLRYHSEVTFQSVELPNEKAPFLVPAQVTTTLTTSKGTIVLVSKYTPRR